MTREEAVEIMVLKREKIIGTASALPKGARERSGLHKEIEAYTMSIAALQEPEIVHCNDCKLHNSCSTEDVFNFVRIENGFCAVGSRRQI